MAPLGMQRIPLDLRDRAMVTALTAGQALVKPGLFCTPFPCLLGQKYRHATQRVHTARQDKKLTMFLNTDGP